ncbi:MAG: hypothetical protein WC477_00040 [Patescibacteria group bacterium]
MPITTAKLIRKMARAEMILEGVHIQHENSCPVISEHESVTPCDCGASALNNKVHDALQELEIEEDMEEKV